MKEFCKRNGIFLGLSLILVVVLGLGLLGMPKGELHLMLCDRHSHARDIFYRYYTHVGEWFPYVLCIALLLFGRIGHGVFASAAMLLSTLSTQILKHIFVAPRPVTWFGEHMPHIDLPLVEGVKMNLWYSFPSGHTTSFFAMTLLACILITDHLTAKRSNSANGLTAKRSYSAAVQLLLFLAATLGAYSRIYLSQHFAMDVFAGILVGELITILCYVVFIRYKDQKWFNYRLISKK